MSGAAVGNATRKGRSLGANRKMPHAGKHWRVDSLLLSSGIDKHMKDSIMQC